MRSIVLVAACLACAGHARRSHSDQPDFKSLARLLLASSPRSAFSHAASPAQVGRLPDQEERAQTQQPIGNSYSPQQPPGGWAQARNSFWDTSKSPVSAKLQHQLELRRGSVGQANNPHRPDADPIIGGSRWARHYDDGIEIVNPIHEDPNKFDNRYSARQLPGDVSQIRSGFWNSNTSPQSAKLQQQTELRRGPVGQVGSEFDNSYSSEQLQGGSVGQARGSFWNGDSPSRDAKLHQQRFIKHSHPAAIPSHPDADPIIGGSKWPTPYNDGQRIVNPILEDRWR